MPTAKEKRPMSKFTIDELVEHRHKSHYPLGTVVSVDAGCNAVYWVDFGREFLTVCSELDITKVESV